MSATVNSYSSSTLHYVYLFKTVIAFVLRQVHEPASEQASASQLALPVNFSFYGDNDYKSLHLDLLKG